MNKLWQRFHQRILTPEKTLPPWDWGLAATLIILYLLVHALALLLVVSLAGEDFSTSDPTLFPWVGILGGGISFFLILQYSGLALRQAQQEKRSKRLPNLALQLRLTPSENTPLWVILFMALGAAILLDTIGFRLGVPFDSDPIPLNGLTLGGREVFAFLGAVVVMIIIRPIVEELLFRGLLYTTLLKRFSPYPAILVSALAFALVHYGMDDEYLWWGFIQPLVLGLVAGFYRASTKSTQAAIGVHMMFAVFSVLRSLI